MKTFMIFFIGLLASSLPAWAGTGPNDFQLTSSAFEANSSIPKKYTCEGENVNPPLEFKNVPMNAQSLALTVTDPDVPSGTWTHWIIYNMPSKLNEINENTDPGTDGTNDFGKSAYGGPCPPPGKLHHYIFSAYALDSTLNISESPHLNEIEGALKGHVIAQTQLVGTYQK